MDDAQEHLPPWALKEARKKPQVTVPEMETKLTNRYKGKYCSFTYPGFQTIMGKVDAIALEYIKEPIVVIQMNDKRYTCSLESITDCLKLLKNE